MWSLAIHSDAMPELRRAGSAFVRALQDMRAEPQPWLDDLYKRKNHYERFVAGHWVGYQIDHERKLIRVIYIQQ